MIRASIRLYVVVYGKAHKAPPQGIGHPLMTRSGEFKSKGVYGCLRIVRRQTDEAGFVQTSVQLDLRYD